MAEKRRGNLLITLSVFIFVVLVLTGLFANLNTQRATARVKAVYAGDTDTYITLTNLCADAFQSDIEGQVVRLYADVGNPDGWQIENAGYEIFDTAVKMMQKGDASNPGLQRGDNLDTGEWYYQLTDPSDALAYAGIEREDITKITERLLKNGTVSICVKTDFDVNSIQIDDDGMRENEKKWEMGDIFYTVTLRKGTTKVNQEYKISGEILVARYDDTMVRITVDGSKAKNQMISQTVTRRNKGN